MIPKLTADSMTKKPTCVMLSERQKLPEDTSQRIKTQVSCYCIYLQQHPICSQANHSTRCFHHHLLPAPLDTPLLLAWKASHNDFLYIKNHSITLVCKHKLYADYSTTTALQ